MYFIGFLIGLLNEVNLPTVKDIFIGEIMYISLCLILILKYKDIKITKNMYVYIIFGFSFLLFSVLGSYYYNIGINNSVLASVKYFEIFILVISTFILLMYFNDKFIKFLLSYLITILFIELLIDIYKKLGFVYFIHYNGSIIVLITIIIIENRLKSNNFKYILSICVFIILLIGQSRTGIAIFMIYILIKTFLYIYYHLNKNKRMLYILISTLILLVLSIPAMNYLIEYFSIPTASNVERLGLIKLSFNLFLNSPIVGIGPNNYYKYIIQNKELFPYTTISSAMTLSPHNFYLEILSSYGLIGFILMFTPIFYIIFNSMKNNLNKFNTYICIYFIIFIGLTPISGNTRFLFSILLGLIIYYSKKSCDKIVK